MKGKRGVSASASPEDEERTRGKRLQLHSSAAVGVQQGLVVAAGEEVRVEAAETRGLRLLNLLLRCAESVAMD